MKSLIQTLVILALLLASKQGMAMTSTTAESRLTQVSDILSKETNSPDWDALEICTSTALVKRFQLNTVCKAVHLER